ncbi:hypothetical protein RI054_25g107770 [Pseudoscourfieldia marina]
MCPYALFNDASNYAFRFLAGYGVVTDGCPLRHHGVRLLVGSSPPTQRCVAVPVRLLLFRIFHRQAPSQIACTAVTTGVRSSPCWSASRFPHPVGS